MKHITQNISGNQLNIHCTKCGESKTFTIKNRATTDLEIQSFEKSHKHASKSK